jgi:signal recognition particle subunit SRP54
MGDMLSLIEKAERSVDPEAAREVEKHIRTGHLTFDDFLLQIRQLRGMGSVAGVLEMLPGGAQMQAQAGGDPEAEIRKMESMILSMTPRERAHPEVIDGSRRRRIARGSGTQPSDVNRLLESRKQIQQLIKQIGRPGAKPGRAGALGRLFGM